MKVAGFIPLVIALAVAGCGGGGSPPEPPVAIPCTAFLQWQAPASRMDGTAILPGELDKFTIFVSSSPAPADMLIVLVVDVEDGNLTSWEVKALSSSQHYFWVTVTDTESRESGPSNVEEKNCN